MYILGIDTATKVAGAAVVKDGRLVSERFIHNKLTHSQVLLPMVDQVIKDAGITIQDITGVAVVGGPGSFTGLRIGMAFAKSIAQVLGISVASVSTLEVLAYNQLYFHGLICPIMDARKKEVYTCLYDGSEGVLQPLSSPKALSIDELLKFLNNFEEEIIFLGDGIPVYFDQIKDTLGERARKASPLNRYSRAAAVALLGTEEINQGITPDLYDINPVYLRRSEAEITWEKKRREATHEKTGCDE